MVQLNRHGINSSYNQLIAVFNEIASTHDQINGFGTGEKFEITANTVINYPLLWVQVIPGGTFTRNTINYKCRLSISDLIDPALKNETQVRSDIVTILWDVVNMVFDDYDIYVTYPAQLTPYSQASTDFVAGWTLDTILEIPTQWSYADIPIRTSINIPDDILINDNSDFLIDSDGSFLSAN